MVIPCFSLILFFINFRAHSLRPGYNEVEQGINKSKDAIENCLCRDGFTFDGMKDVRDANWVFLYFKKFYFHYNFCF